MKNQALVSVIFLILLRSVIADDEDICGKVDCGKGICKSPAANMAGFVCVCEPGWSQLHFGNHFRFLPCNIPDCDFKFSCYNDSLEHSIPSFPSSTAANNIFDPCFWSFCGEGKCEMISTFAHECQCREGFSNLLNISSFPCIKECVLVANCDHLRIPLTNSTSSSPKVDANHAEGSVSTRSLLCLLLALITILTANQAL